MPISIKFSVDREAAIGAVEQSRMETLAFQKTIKVDERLGVDATMRSFYSSSPREAR